MEFQKRDLPHAHILVWLAGDHREISPTLIDSFISAEIPDSSVDPLGYALVTEFMTHGPCGVLNEKCPCMKKGKCSKNYPKNHQEETIIDSNGFPIYKRSDNNRYVIKNGCRLDNRWIVPYNMSILKKFQAHINVEWCNKTKILKYLFKYVTKGPDQSKILFQKTHPIDTNDTSTINTPIDEIKEYLDCRYICEQDALWRIYGYDIHTKIPAVERLPVHMPNMNMVRFRSNSNLANIVSNDFSK